MQRRHFLAATAAALAPRATAADKSTLTVLLKEPIGTISPMLHGHFVEHLGGVVYDGIWVGENSKIPNVGGIRKSIVDSLKGINAPVFRWPGGCYADSFNWKDTIGPRAQRPRRTNFWASNGLLRNQTGGPAKYEPNTFGTNEFIQFCQLTGGKPYLAANVRSSNPREFYEWIEYCNAPAGTTTWGDMRGGNAFNVEFWGVGNESWGCGGEMTGAEYALEFRKFTAWVPGFNVPLKYVAAGPNGGDLAWSHGFFEGIARKNPGLFRRVWGWGLHYYTGTAGKPVDFTTDEYVQLYKRSQRMEQIITDHWAVMGQYDREHRVKFAIDEWGTWHQPGTEVAPHHLLGQQATMRDAVIAGLTLDIFNRHADKVAMANIAQLVNCLQSLYLTHEDKFLETVNYHVFALHQAHHNGQSLRMAFPPSLPGSASLKGKTLTVTVVNPDPAQPAAIDFAIPGASVKSSRADTIASARLQDHNTFAEPQKLKPRPLASGDPLPPASVTRFTIELA